MKIGQRVILIVRTLDSLYVRCDGFFPPIGSVGILTVDLDEDGDYEVEFDNHPWGSNDPSWYVLPSWIVPIMDDEKEKESEVEKELFELC